MALNDRWTLGRARTALVVGFTALATASTAVTAPAHAATPAWKVTKTFKYAEYSSVHGVTTVGKKEAWAFTGTNDAMENASTPIAQRWNGKKWSSVALPSGLRGNLHAGAASSRTNVWAIGGADGGASYVVRWNGTQWALSNKWAEGQVTGITVIGPQDVWVFGASGRDHGVGTWHYDGSSWTQVAAPFTPIRAAKVSGSDIWAIGRGAQGDSRTIGHWDGKEWKTVSTGKALPTDLWQGEGKPWRNVFVTGILARSAGDVWVTGREESGSGAGRATAKAVLVHWDGKAWKRVKAPGSGLGAIASDGGKGLWFTESVESGGSYRSVMRHRTAAGEWTTAKVTGTGKRVPLVQDIALLPGTRTLIGGGWLRPKDNGHSDGAIFTYSG